MSGKITIDGLLLELEAATAEARSVATPVTPEQFNWKPDPETWSVGECFEHLIRTNENYHRRLQRVISEANLPAGADGWSPGFVGGMFLRRMEPPVRRRYPAPRVFRPETTNFDREETLSRFEEGQRRLAELIESARGQDLTRVKVASPAAKWLKFSVAAAFAIITSHERRHLWQARNVSERARNSVLQIP